MINKIAKPNPLQVAPTVKTPEKHGSNIITKIALASISIGIAAKLYKVYSNKTAYQTPSSANVKDQETSCLQKNIPAPQTPRIDCKTPPNSPSNPDFLNTGNSPFEITSNPTINQTAKPTQQLSQQDSEDTLTEMVSEFFTLVHFEQNEEKKSPTPINSQDKSQSETEVTSITSPSTIYQYKAPSQFPYLLTER